MMAVNSNKLCALTGHRCRCSPRSSLMINSIHLSNFSGSLAHWRSEVYPQASAAWMRRPGMRCYCAGTFQLFNGVHDTSQFIEAELTYGLLVEFKDSTQAIVAR